MIEYFDIVDEAGNPTGETVERARAHREGIRHRTAHVWIFRKTGGRMEVLLQKRSSEKDSFPGCYDISSAGHIRAGDGFLASAIRELKEELGVDISQEDLHAVGLRVLDFDGTFHEKPFLDREVAMVFYLLCDLDVTAFHLQREEVESVRYFDFETCYRSVSEGRADFPHCLYAEELEMLKKALRTAGIL